MSLKIPEIGVGKSLLQRKLNEYDYSIDRKENFLYIRNMSNIRKSELNDEQLENYARMFKALSNPTRLKIFLIIAGKLPPGQTCQVEDENMTCCQRKMAEEFGMAPSTISHHVKELFNAGLLKMSRDGQQVSMWIENETVEILHKLLEGMGY